MCSMERTSRSFGTSPGEKWRGKHLTQRRVGHYAAGVVRISFQIQKTWAVLLFFYERERGREREKASCFNHVQARETAAERLQDSMFCCSHFLTASINSTCSYIDCRVLSAPTLHLSGHTVWKQPSLLLLRGAHRGPLLAVSLDRWSCSGLGKALISLSLTEPHSHSHRLVASFSLRRLN